LEISEHEPSDPLTPAQARSTPSAVVSTKGSENPDPGVYGGPRPKRRRSGCGGFGGFWAVLSHEPADPSL